MDSSADDGADDIELMSRVGAGTPPLRPVEISDQRQRRSILALLSDWQTTPAATPAGGRCRVVR